MDTYKNLYLETKQKYFAMKLGAGDFSPLMKKTVLKNAERTHKENKCFQKRLSMRRNAVDEDEFEYSLDECEALDEIEELAKLNNKRRQSSTKAREA